MGRKARERPTPLCEVEAALRVKGFADPDETKIDVELTQLREKTARLNALRLSNAMSTAGR